MEKKLYIAEVEKMLGVNRKTLFYWEKVGKIPMAKREKMSNYRVWTKAQVEIIKRKAKIMVKLELMKPYKASHSIRLIKNEIKHPELQKLSIQLCKLEEKEEAGKITINELEKGIKEIGKRVIAIKRRMRG